MAVNAIALAHALVPGRHEELEHCRLPDIAGLRALVETIACAKYDIDVLECDYVECSYVRLTGTTGKTVEHNCDVGGAAARNLVAFRGRSLHCFQDLPAAVRLQLLASFVGPENLAGVSVRTFAWSAEGPKPPPPCPTPFRSGGGASKVRMTSATSAPSKSSVLARSYESAQELHQ